MTFTYTPTTPDNITRVRYHVGDTAEDSAIFSDEEITFAIAEAGSWQGAVIDSIASIMARLSTEPDMTADWLRVDWRRSADNWRILLSEKKRKFGVGGATSSAGGRHAWRPDSLQRSEPTYDERLDDACLE